MLVARCAGRAAGRPRPRRGRGHRGLRSTAPCRRGRAGRRCRPLARHARLEPRRPTAGGRRRRHATADARRLVPRHGTRRSCSTTSPTPSGAWSSSPASCVRVVACWRASTPTPRAARAGTPSMTSRERTAGRRPAGTSSSRRRRRRSSARSGSMTRAAIAAGLVDVSVEEVDVDVGVTDPRRLVDYRFGQAQFADSIARAPPACGDRSARRRRRRRRPGDGAATAPAVVFLRARVVARDPVRNVVAVTDGSRNTGRWRRGIVASSLRPRSSPHRAAATPARRRRRRSSSSSSVSSVSSGPARHRRPRPERSLRTSCSS